MTEKQLLKKLKINGTKELIKQFKHYENIALKRGQKYLGRKFILDNFLAEQFLDGKEVDKYWEVMTNYYKLTGNYPQ